MNPLEQSVEAYLIIKRKRLTPRSERAYCSALSEFVAYFSNCDLTDLEPPMGSSRLEEYLTIKWGRRALGTYNKNHSILNNFFTWCVARGTLNRNPMLTIERAKRRDFHRVIFTEQECVNILAANPEPRDQVALKLLLHYGIRKGALQRIRFEHFDASAQRLTVFTKGETIHTFVIPDPLLWQQLALLEGQSGQYLMPARTTRKRKPLYWRELDRLHALLAESAQLLDTIDTHEKTQLRQLLSSIIYWSRLATDTANLSVTLTTDEPFGDHGLHDWWYRCLYRAGLVPKGTTHGRRMHSARHTAGQRILERTHNLKVTQKQLGHSTINTTGDIYTDLDADQVGAEVAFALGIDNRS